MNLRILYALEAASQAALSTGESQGIFPAGLHRLIVRPLTAANRAAALEVCHSPFSACWMPDAQSHHQGLPSLR